MADDGCHPYQSSSPCCRRGGWQSRHEPHKRGLNAKLHLVVDSHGMPLRFVLSKGSAADCHHAPALMAGMPAEYLLADKA